MTARPASTAWPAIAIAALAVVAIILGLIATGGPMQGRKERRDEVRQADLWRLGALAECLSREAGGPLPETLAPTIACPGEVRLADPYTGAPYRYEVVAERRIRVCATFETDLIARYRVEQTSFDAAEGCILYFVPEPANPLPVPR